MTENSTRIPLLSPSKIMVIAANTCTQLVRMKVFYFLVFFAIIIIGVQFFELPYTAGPESYAHEKLRMLKAPAFGAMTLFSVIFAIVATALLIPRDIEDRTLYTIICKPVPRLDYLLGKLFGVLIIIFFSLLFMDLLTNLMLHFQTKQVLAERLAYGQSRGWTEEAIAVSRQEILMHGPTWNLQLGIWAIFLKASIMSAIALLISTFSTSTLFTIIISSVTYFICHFSGNARELWENTSTGEASLFTTIAAKIFSVLFPDLSLFNVIDGAIAAKPIGQVIILQLSGITFLYVLVFTILSWFVFVDKEF